MYPLGFLFGLGFDTATEIGLLGISAMQVAKGMPIWSMLVFPALFTSGMALVDTTDGVLMVGAYGWAFANPIRKLWYNLTITALSVAVAFLIGGIEALGLHFRPAGPRRPVLGRDPRPQRVARGHWLCRDRGVRAVLGRVSPGLPLEAL